MSRGNYRTILWNKLDSPGMEYCYVYHIQNQWLMWGTALLADQGQPVQLTYRITCAEDWTTRGLVLNLLRGEHRAQRMADVRAGVWQIYPESSSTLEGCTDLDLGFTPCTNSLPIKRLNLAVGQSADITAAWLRFPELEFVPLRQRYTRLEEQLYLYESLESGYRARLDVDDFGLVTHYEARWDAVASQGDVHP